MIAELDTDELALHNYQLEHFNEIVPFVLRHMIRYGVVAGALLTGFLYLLTYRDPPPNPILTLINYPPPTISEFVVNYLLRIPIGAIVGYFVGAGLGLIYAKLIQVTCHKQVSKDYVEPYDVSFPFMLYQIGLPILVTYFIILITMIVRWDATSEHGLLFTGANYVVVLWVLSEVTRRFLKWYIPPILPPLE